MSLSEADTERLRSFVGWIVEERHEHDGANDIDAGDLQDAMVEHGLLAPTKVAEPCGEGCFCAEYCGEDDFPVTCFRYTELADWAMRKPSKPVSKEGQ